MGTPITGTTGVCGDHAGKVRRHTGTGDDHPHTFFNGGAGER
jgi:hypothetical protein